MNETGLYCVIFYNIQYHDYLWNWEFWGRSADQLSSADSIYGTPQLQICPKFSVISMIETHNKYSR